jgi:hypothetical protein
MNPITFEHSSNIIRLKQRWNKSGTGRFPLSWLLLHSTVFVIFAFILLILIPDTMETSNNDYFMEIPSFVLSAQETNLQMGQPQENILCPVAFYSFHVSPVSSVHSDTQTNINLLSTEFAAGSQGKPVKLMNMHPCVNDHSQSTIYALNSSGNFRLAYISMKNNYTANSLQVFDLKHVADDLTLTASYSSNTSDTWDGIPLRCNNCTEYISKRAQSFSVPSALVSSQGTLIARASNPPLLLFYIAVVAQKNEAPVLGLVQRKFMFQGIYAEEVHSSILESRAIDGNQLDHNNSIIWIGMNIPSLSFSSSVHFADEEDLKLSCILYSFSTFLDFGNINNNTMYNVGIYYRWFSVNENADATLSNPVLIDSEGVAGTIAFVHQEYVAMTYWKPSETPGYVDIIYTYCFYNQCDSTAGTNRVLVASFAFENLKQLNSPQIAVILDENNVTNSRIIIAYLSYGHLYHLLCFDVTCSSISEKKTTIDDFTDYSPKDKYMELMNLQLYMYNTFGGSTSSIPMVATSISHPLLGLSLYILPATDDMEQQALIFSQCPQVSESACVVMQNLFHYSAICGSAPDPDPSVNEGSKRHVILLAAVVSVAVVFVILTLTLVLLLFLRRIYVRQVEKSRTLAPPVELNNIPAAPKPENRVFFNIQSESRFAVLSSTSENTGSGSSPIDIESELRRVREELMCSSLNIQSDMVI